jgi:hypothetical protein
LSGWGEASVDRKRLIIIAVAAAFLLIVVGSGIYFAFANNSSADNSSITPDHYYVDKGLETLAKFAKPAVENFAIQNKSESTASRNGRLRKYFTNDSQVYGYSLDNLDPFIDKTSAKMTSVTHYSGEDADTVILVMVWAQFYSKNQLVFSDNQTYIVSFDKDSKGSYGKPFDILEQQ